MSVFVFLGPTLPSTVARRYLDATFLPPAAHGDVLRVLRHEPAVIGVVDGTFQFVPTLWHKEILAALEEGVRVYGAASMGALRAAELAPFGMVGVGEVFEMFRTGACQDDDEVAVTFAARELGYRPLSEAMVDIRDLCQAAVRRRIIDAAAAATLTTLAKRLYFPMRTWEAVEREAASSGVAAATLDRLRVFRRACGPTLKQRDAIRMLRRIAALPRRRRRPRAGFRVEPTIFLARSRHDVSREAAGAADAPPGGAVDVARKKALLGLLASKEAIRTGLGPSERAVDEMTGWFRERYGLADDRSFADWLAASNLDEDRFDRGMRRFATVVHMEEVHRAQLERETEDYLRLYGAASARDADSPQWVQVNVALSRSSGTPRAKARVLFERLLGAMPRLRRAGRLLAFHFVRKDPDIRLRFESVRPSEGLMPMIEALLTDLARRGYITSARPSIYEPESRQFGGPRAMAAVHDYFHADSVNWILWARLAGRRRQRRTEMASGAILSDLFAETLGCGSEVWDAWHNVSALTEGRLGTADDARIDAVSLQQLDGWASAGERVVLRRYRAANRRLAAALQQIWADGDLTVGTRTLLPFVAMFHCNRFGIDGDRQAALAHAMADAWDPKRELLGAGTTTGR